jgi:molybdenum cofactor cytidylyltransferase
MGTQKLLLPLGGKPVIARVVDELLGSPVDCLLVVVGRDGDQIRSALGNRPVQFVPNSDPASDMLGSVRCGLRARPNGCQGLLVAVGDQPGIARDLVGEMIRCFRRDESKIIVPVSAGCRGHPVLFGARYYVEVLSRYDGCGLRGLLAAHPEEIIELAVCPANVLEDMDTPADYQRQKEWLTPSVTPEPVPPRDQSG